MHQAIAKMSKGKYTHYKGLVRKTVEDSIYMLIRNTALLYRDRSQIDKQHGIFKFGHYNYLCIEVVSARTRSKGQKEKTHTLQSSGQVILLPFFPVHPQCRLLLSIKVHLKLVMQPDCYSQELIVVPESSIAEGAVCAFNWLYIFLFKASDRE